MSFEERKVSYVHTPDCGPSSCSSSFSRSVKYDKVDGCKIDIILLPADEVGIPAQFVPGDRVMGYIYCLLTKALVCTEFKLKLKGEGSCRFDLYVNPFEDESPPNGGGGQSWRSKMLSKTFVDSRQMTTHTNKEVYVNTSYDILQEDLPKTAQRNFSSTDKNQLVYILEPGEYRFPFSFQLPMKLPPSLIADEGKIAYNCSIFLSLPHFQNVFKVISRPIPVICKTYLPVRTPKKPKGKTNRETVSCSEGGEVLEEIVIGCCMPDHLDLSVCWDKEKYAPGECLLVTSNLTTTAPKEVAVHGGYVNLIQVATFTAKDGEVKVKENSVMKRDFICHPLVKFPLSIPVNVPPSNLQHCSFITLRYIVRFKLYTEYTTMETKWNVAMGPTVVYQNISPPSKVVNSSRRHSSQLGSNDHPSSVDSNNTYSQRMTTKHTARANSIPGTEPSAPPLQSCDDVTHLGAGATRSSNKKLRDGSGKNGKNKSAENNQNNPNVETSGTTSNPGDSDENGKPPSYEEVILLDSRNSEDTTQTQFSEDDEVAFERTPFYLSYHENETILRS